MILRRFTQHIKEQNWFAVGLDVIVVIVGIFLGMQFSEWNDERNERDEEILLKSRLSDDLETSISRIESGITALESIINQQHTAASLIIKKGIDSENIHTFRELRDSFDSIFPLIVDTGTMDEIFSSGKIVIIQDIVLRKELNSYRILVNSTEAWTETYRQEVGNQITSLQYTAPTGFRGEESGFLVPEDTLNKKRLEIFNAMKIIHDLNSIQLRFFKGHKRSLSSLKEKLTASME